MKACTSGLPAGINLDCLANPAPIDGIILTDNDVSFTKAEILSLSSWKTEIQEELSVWVPAGIENYEPTTDDAQITTTGSLRKTVIRKPPPSGNFFLRSNVCDFNEVMRALKGGTLRVMFIHADGSIGGYKDRNGTAYKGFKAEVHGHTPGITPQEGGESMYKVMLNFFNYFEFEQQFNIGLGWSPLAELPNAMPESYAMEFVSETQAAAPSTSDIVINLFEACGDAITTLAVADIDVIDSSLNDDTVSGVTNGSGGEHTIELTDAIAGQWITFRVKKLTGSVVDQISNPIHVEFS
jgi:hypothetical protein